MDGGIAWQGRDGSEVSLGRQLNALVEPMQEDQQQQQQQQRHLLDADFPWFEADPDDIESG